MADLKARTASVTNGQPLILPVWKFFDAAGLPLAGGKLYSYAAGMTTCKRHTQTRRKSRLTLIHC
jgi:hypothetical protein